MRLEVISAVSVDAAVLGRARAVERLRSKTGVISSEAEAVMQYAAYPLFLHRNWALNEFFAEGTNGKQGRRGSQRCWV